eukprot:1186068-Prorocentrum_minimum.AAC.1
MCLSACFASACDTRPVLALRAPRHRSARAPPSNDASSRPTWLPPYTSNALEYYISIISRGAVRGFGRVDCSARHGHLTSAKNQREGV